MTSATAIPRYTLCMLFPIVAAGCSQSLRAPSVTAVDFLRTLPRAEKRPPTGFAVSSYEIGGVHHGVIVAAAPSRAIWSLPVPRRSYFRAFVAARTTSEPTAGAVRVRIGISDDRIYEGLAEAVLTPDAGRWSEIHADLSAYAGWKWSVFYHPDRITWRIVLAADPMGTAPATVMWGAPQILTDSESALEYASRR